MKKDRKVVPIRGKHETFNSMAGEAMEATEWVRGFMIGFEEDGTMHFGESKITRQDVGMALMYLHMVAAQMMEQPD